MTGPRLLAIVSIAIFVMCVGIVLTVEPGQAAAAAAVRWTARTSLVLFACAYVARPLVQVWPHRASKWLLANRKWIGLGFAASHFMHLEALVALAAANPDAFWAARGLGNSFGITTYALLAAMVVTSNERIKKQMNARTWKRLHLTGMHAAWLVFTTTYVRGLGQSAGYIVPVLILVGIAAVRGLAFARAYRRSRARAARVQAAS